MLSAATTAFTNRQPTFFYDNEQCRKARQVQEKWYIQQKSGKKINREVDDSKIFALQRTYRRHKKEEDFHNTICRIKYWKSNKYERFFLVLNDWAGAKEKPYSSLPKPCHGNAFKENAKKIVACSNGQKNNNSPEKKLG